MWTLSCMIHNKKEELHSSSFFRGINTPPYERRYLTMNIKNEIFKLIYGGKATVKKKIFVKEIDVLKIEPWISKGNFDIEHADVLLEDIHEKQYMRDDIIVKDVYKDINMLIEGAYIAGLNDSKDMSDEYINTRTRELISKIKLLR